MEREKIIEEILYKFCERHGIEDKCYDSGKKCADMSCAIRLIATKIVNKYIPDGAVVLTKEEYERLASYISEERAREIFHEETKKLKEKIRKETANAFATNFENYLCDVNTDYCTDDIVPEALYTRAEIDKVMDRTLKDFGVEVDE